MTIPSRVRATVDPGVVPCPYCGRRVKTLLLQYGGVHWRSPELVADTDEAALREGAPVVAVDPLERVVLRGAHRDASAVAGPGFEPGPPRKSLHALTRRCRFDLFTGRCRRCGRPEVCSAEIGRRCLVGAPRWYRKQHQRWSRRQLRDLVRAIRSAARERQAVIPGAVTVEIIHPLFDEPLIRRAARYWSPSFER